MNDDEPISYMTHTRTCARAYGESWFGSFIISFEKLCKFNSGLVLELMNDCNGSFINFGKENEPYRERQLAWDTRENPTARLPIQPANARRRLRTRARIQS